MENDNQGVFNKLFAINVNELTEKKSKLTYLSWTFAWSEVKKNFPDASYKIWKDDKGNPFTFSETLGYMCYTTVTINNESLEMWLPVMNGANKAMKSIEYEYATKYGKKSVEPATMFDINKTIMRCLVKNLAMFGLGLYIYSGEDLPEGEKPEPVKKPEPTPPPVYVAPPIEDFDFEGMIGTFKTKNEIVNFSKKYALTEIQKTAVKMKHKELK